MSFPPYGYPGQSQHSIYVYHRRAHTDTDQAPLERSGVADPRLLPTSELLSEAFLWSEHRKVTKVATVSLHGNTDEVDGALVGRRVELGFDPFALAAVQVRRDGRTMGTGVPHRIGRHTHSQAHADTPAPAPERFGNDYSRLIPTTPTARQPDPASTSTRSPSPPKRPRCPASSRSPPQTTRTDRDDRTSPSPLSID